MKLINAGVEVHQLRDLTRGDLATALVEIAEVSHLHIEIDESAIPVGDAVQGACGILGFDSLYVANEGRFVAFVYKRDSDTALEILTSDSSSPNPCVIGSVMETGPGAVTLRNLVGAERYVSMLSGEQLLRIC